MAKLTVKFLAKYRHLVFKYQDDDVKMFALRHISWYSFPIVYPNFQDQYKSTEAEYLKIRAKRKRYRNHLRKMIDRYGNLYLVTLTFGDCYDTTNTDSRKKYVLRWLNDYTVDYFGCLDIGKKGGREHYHCICALDTTFSPVKLSSRCSSFYLSFPDLEKWHWGFSSCKAIASTSKGLGEFSALDYAFKSAIYSFKSAENNSQIKPFHKRGVDYSEPYLYQLTHDSDLIE